ncbi:MAG: replicative DNA helicase [Candidatus Amoebophilus sp.]
MSFKIRLTTINPFVYPKAHAKMLPQSIELEQSILGALLLEKDALTDIIDILKPSSFYEASHQQIYQAIIDLFNSSSPVDLRTVVDELRKKGKLEEVGGAYYLASLTSRISSAANIEYHARSVIEYAIKRELIEVSSSIHKHAYESTTDVFMLLDHAEQCLFDVTDSNIRKNYTDIRNLMGEAFKELEARRHHKDGLTGIPSGFIALDRLTAGWQRSDLVIVAARPGMGKTAFMLSLLRNAAIDHGHAVAIFSLEMSSLQLVNRLIAAEAELESEKIKKGTLADHEWQQLTHKTAQLSKAPIFIDDTPSLSVFELRTKCRRLKAKHDIQLVVIDYLQLMTVDARKGFTNREQEIATISRSLKNLAKELNVPIIAPSQLSRAVETRGGDKRPMLSDLRESGAIEQDADMVLFLYRPEYYGITEDELGNPTEGLAEVIIAKHRNGSLDSATLKFIGKYTKFTDLDDMPFADSNNYNDFETVTRNSKVNGSALNLHHDFYNPDSPELKE